MGWEFDVKEIMNVDDLVNMLVFFVVSVIVIFFGKHMYMCRNLG